MVELFRGLKFRATVKSPIHIGTGIKINPIGFVIDSSSRNNTSQTVKILDEDKLFRYLSENNLENAALDLASTIESGRPLGDWFKRHRIDRDKLTAYELNLKRTPNSNVTEISQFMRSCDHTPFIPGSSLKGSLRSAWLRGILLDNSVEREEAARIVETSLNRNDNKAESPSGKIEKRVFIKSGVEDNHASNYDINRMLVLRDSLPLSSVNLDLSEVKTFSIRDGQLVAKNYSNFVETLSPGIEFDIDFKVNLYLAYNEAMNLQFDDKVQYVNKLVYLCRLSSLDILRQEIQFYQEHGLPELSEWYKKHYEIIKNEPKATFMLPIGWGSGYDAKTVTEILGDNVFKLVTDKCSYTKGLGRPGNNRNNKWLGPRLSPKSRKIAVWIDENKKAHKLPMGWLLIKRIAA